MDAGVLFGSKEMITQVCCPVLRRAVLRCAALRCGRPCCLTPFGSEAGCGVWRDNWTRDKGRRLPPAFP